MVAFTGIYEENTMTKVHVGGYEIPEPKFAYKDNFVTFDAP